jgi:hypothetical protein
VEDETDWGIKESQSVWDLVQIYKIVLIADIVKRSGLDLPEKSG